jgi:hypothetical protein
MAAYLLWLVVVAPPLLVNGNEAQPSLELSYLSFLEHKVQVV